MGISTYITQATKGLKRLVAVVEDFSTSRRDEQLRIQTRERIRRQLPDYNIPIQPTKNKQK